MPSWPSSGAWFSRRNIPASRACLVYAAFGSLLLQRRGIRGLVQAGTAAFLFKAQEHDDGGPTHYSYMFDPAHPLSAARIARGGFPEGHCWIGIVETQEILDVTTGHLPELLFESMPQERWTAPKPPDFFWGTGPELPDGWHYACQMPALHYAFSLIRKTWPEVHAELKHLHDRSLQPASAAD